MDDDIWVCNAPIHYCDLPSAANEDDSEQADYYFFSKTSDDTVYYEPAEGEDTVPETWNQEIATVKEEETFPVIRRRSRSVGSRPLFLRKPEPTSNQNSNVRRSAVPKAPQTTTTVDDPDHYFVEGLRAYNPVKKAFDASKSTKPMPFNLTKSKKKIVQDVNPSMAEGVQKWEKKTPERFHSSRQGQVYQSIQRFEMHATEAHTPHLTAMKRHRPVQAVSREVREQREVDEMKKNQFKAHAIDEKVFKAPVLPVKKETRATKFEPFHLSESHKKENIAPETENEYHFHARPAPKFETQTVERPRLPLTVPETPKFSEAGKASLHSWRRQRSRSNGSLASSMHSGSSNGSQTLLNSATERPKNTVIAPFSFEDRDKMVQKNKEKKIQKVMEEERKQREFHANPCPNFSHPPVAERPTVLATRSVPFQLSCDTRGLSKKEKFLQQLEEMRLEERKATQFKAQPAKILTKEPFKVKLDHTRSNLTKVEEFSLASSKRAVERKDFDEWLKKQELENEAIRQQREEERLQKEAEEAARLREETTFVANPIRKFKAVEIRKAEPDLLTVPKTPKFMKPQ